MNKKVAAVVCSLALTVSVSACKKRETQPPAPQVPGPMMQGPISPEAQQTVPGHGVTVPKGETQVVVPDSVKGRWSAVKIVVEDRGTKKTQEYKISLHSDFVIPNSNLKVTVGEFLPDFKMDGLTLTSVSNQPNNPAVGIRVFEGDKQIFPAPEKQWGWLFSKMPSVHPFEHPKYGITLKEGVKKG
ncbi:MAG: DUF2155 domain-containing protein [Nitrospirae bacterium]|nr:DUF2155 domain-containing protein [Nitrospirota bacterium]